MYKKNFSVLVLMIVIMSFAVAAQVGPADGTGAYHDEIVAAGGQGGEPVAGEGRGMMAQSGEYIGQQGKKMQLSKQVNNRFKLEVGGVSADCPFNFTQEQFENRTRLYAGLSNGRNAEVKIMPDTASETALQRLRLRNCDEDCVIEMKEVGLGDSAKLAYEMRTQRNSKVFGLFNARMNIQAQVDAETGELIRTGKPWWAFLASETSELEE